MHHKRLTMWTVSAARLRRELVANALVRELNGGEDKLTREKIRAANSHRLGQDAVYFGKRELFAVRQPAAGPVALSFREKKIVRR